MPSNRRASARLRRPPPAQRALLALTVLVLPTALSLTLPSTVHDMESTQIPGTYFNVELITGAGFCPDAIRISQVEPLQTIAGVLYLLPHQFTTLPLKGGGETKCQATQINGSDVTTQSATLLRRSSQLPNLNESFDLIAKFRLAQEEFYMGIELGPRICGRLPLAADTVSMWMAPGKEIVAQAGNFTLRFTPGFKYIYYFPAERACLFRGNAAERGVVAPVASRTPDPTPTPTRTPPAISPPGLPSVPGAASQSPVAPVSPAPALASPVGAQPSLTPGATRLIEPVCFPGRATVRTAGGETVRMERLRVGTQVAVGAGMFSEVFAFTHSDATTWHAFVRVVTERNESLEATDGHFVYANGRAVPAARVRVGDEMSGADGVRTRVRRVERVWARGLYSPQTFHGDVVVGGLVVTTYSSVVGSVEAAHSLLAPVRFAQRLVVRRGAVERARRWLRVGM